MPDRSKKSSYEKEVLDAHSDTLSPEAVLDERTTDVSSVSIALMLSVPSESRSQSHLESHLECILLT